MLAYQSMSLLDNAIPVDAPWLLISIIEIFGSIQIMFDRLWRVNLRPVSFSRDFFEVFFTEPDEKMGAMIGCGKFCCRDKWKENQPLRICQRSMHLVKLKAQPRSCTCSWKIPLAWIFFFFGYNNFFLYHSLDARCLMFHRSWI